MSQQEDSQSRKDGAAIDALLHRLMRKNVSPHLSVEMLDWCLTSLEVVAQTPEVLEQKAVRQAITRTMMKLDELYVEAWRNESAREDERKEPIAEVLAAGA